MNPILTVLMAVYNGETYLRTAMDSILRQTYSDFCFLIVDDASTDTTREIVRSFKDERIQLVCLEKNVGQTAALNVGVHRTTTPWIARMDADDYSAPTRLEELMRSVAADTSLSCVGTYAWTFRDDPAAVEQVLDRPLQHDEIQRASLRGSPIIHGSIVVSRAAILDVGGYDERYRIVADLDLYDRLLPRYTAANIPKQLLGIRQHANQDSRSKRVFDESVEHCGRRLLNNTYSRKDAAVVRATLSRAHVYRARIWGAEHRYMEFWKDLSRAIRNSPKSFLWHCFFAFFVSSIPEATRAKLKNMLRPTTK